MSEIKEKVTGMDFIQKIKKIDRKIISLTGDLNRNLKRYENETNQVDIAALINDIADLHMERRNLEVNQEILNSKITVSYKDEDEKEVSLSLTSAIKMLPIYDKMINTLKGVINQSVEESVRFNPYMSAKIIEEGKTIIAIVDNFDPTVLRTKVEKLEDAKSALKSAISYGNNVKIEL